MATNTRSSVIDELFNPGVLAGFGMKAGKITLNSGNTASLVFPAKTVMFAFGVHTTEADPAVSTVIVPSISTTGGMTTVTYTANANCTIQYFILCSRTEVITYPDAGASSITLTPIP